tara:strand:- start:821 stop:1162 length:342 start_codon:yes stop_codon:yes gene_type:complete
VKVIVEAQQGTLADRPEAAFAALVDAAEADGADRTEWLAKALSAGGATQVAVPVARKPRYRVVADVAEQGAGVYKQAMSLMALAVEERLHRAVRDSHAAHKYATQAHKAGQDV